MVAAAMVVATGFLILTFWVDPAVRRGGELRAGLDARRHELAVLDQQTVTLKSQLENPDAGERRQLAELQARLGALDARIGQLDDKLVPPQRMGQVLQAVLAKHRGLALASLRSLPPEPLLALPADNNNGAAGGKPGAPHGENIYRHGLEVRLAGSYADLLGYVAELERTPQRLLWGGMTLNAAAYPRNELTLTVYTLSRDRDWLAV